MGVLNVRDRLLANPRVYDVVQRLASLGGQSQVEQLFERYVSAPGYSDILELGCGTSIWTPRSFRRLVRTDINSAYFPTVCPGGVEYRLMNAADFSLSEDRFDLVYSMGLYHHLTDEQVVRSLRASASALRPAGKIVVFDAALPKSVLRLHAWIARKLDRGGHVRREEHTHCLVGKADLTIRSAYRCGWGPGLEGVFLEISVNDRP